MTTETLSKGSAIKSILQKELGLYFSSPVAFIFKATFLFISLFVFFWLERFFARNIVDVRPLFSWLPILLIFLVSALSMKMWSEERKIGTLQFMQTMPVKTIDLVLGKFLACFTLVAICLLLTLPLVCTVAFMGNLDWGPVIGAYLATLLLASSYCAIGLYSSIKNENQIVSLIISIAICGVLYGLGHSSLLAFFSNDTATVLSLLSTSGHFESVQRGIIDFRDLYYYLSLTGIFILLNVVSLDKLRWSAHSQQRKSYHSLYSTIAALIVLNVFIANIWLQKVRIFRFDLTEGNQYTLSTATEGVVNQLAEPMLIRGYFSDKTHPLLAPLVPQIKDMLAEYAELGSDKLRVEFIDPRKHVELEKEANQKYNIKPMPFQMADKYQASLVNSYFNILIEYGDKYEVLDFRNLIEVKQLGETGIDVQLRNLEYDLTRSIKKTMSGFQSTDALISSLDQPIELIAYISEDSTLPEQLLKLKQDLKDISISYSGKAPDKFKFSLIDPLANAGKVAKDIEQEYGFKPMAVSILDTNYFYFYMLLKNGDKVVPVVLPEQYNKEALSKSIESSVQRFSPGFLKTVGVYSPAPPPMNPMMMQMGMPPQGGKKFDMLEEALAENHNVKKIDLGKGQIPSDIDLALILSPSNLGEKELFAIDQFLMKGGTVLLATGSHEVEQGRENISAKELNSGLESWLKTKGLELKKGLVYDLNNEPYPVPVQRNLGGFQVQEIRLVKYPLFPDIRGDQFNKDLAITSGLNQVTINWPSALEYKEPEASKGKLKFQTLISSSKDSWFNVEANIQPDYQTYPDVGFPESGASGPFVLAGMLEGEFDSFFKGKNSPLLVDPKVEEAKKAANPEEQSDPAKPEAIVTSVIERSNKTARILLFASNEFLSDQTLQISAATGSDRYRNSVELIGNAIDWSLEDRDLLTIRNRGKYARTLVPMEESEMRIWEYLNYALALIALGMVFAFFRFRQNKYNQQLAECIA